MGETWRGESRVAIVLVLTKDAIREALQGE